MRFWLLLLVPVFFVFAACDDDDDGGCTADSCADWETCNADGVCELLPDRCNVPTDCGGTDVTCDATSHTCVALNPCNEEGTASGQTLPTDSCGESSDCIDSSDCADNERCENLPVDGESFARACCVEGPRGCFEAGTQCEDEFDCESGLCMDRNGGTKYCTQQCTDNAQCPSPITECMDMFVMMVCVEPEQ